MKNNPKILKELLWLLLRARFTQSECLFTQVWTGLTWHDRVGFRSKCMRLSRGRKRRRRRKSATTTITAARINWIDKTNVIHSHECRVVATVWRNHTHAHLRLTSSCCRCHRRRLWAFRVGIWQFSWLTDFVRKMAVNGVDLFNFFFRFLFFLCTGANKCVGLGITFFPSSFASFSFSLPLHLWCNIKLESLKCAVISWTRTHSLIGCTSERYRCLCVIYFIDLMIGLVSMRIAFDLLSVSPISDRKPISERKWWNNKIADISLSTWRLCADWTGGSERSDEPLSFHT